MRHRSRNEDGAMMVLMAIVMVGLLALAGLVIDGGQAYADHRHVQNTVDAAAMAGAGALNQVLFTTGQESTVRTAVASSIATNKANGGFTCNIIDASQNVLQSCPSSDGTAISASAAGVSVRLSNTRNGSFIKVVGIDSFTANASASAQVQGLRGASSPFMICGLDSTHNGYATPLLVESPAGSDNWLINPAAVYNPATGGPVYEIHAPQVPNCDTSSQAFKGLVDDSANYPLPGVWSADTGVHAGPVRNVLARPDACTDKSQLDTATGCSMIVPMCIDGSGQGNSMAMFCVRFGAFLIYQTASNRHDARFLGPAIVASGAGGGRPVPNEARVIRLSE